MTCKFCSNPVKYASLGICEAPACWTAYDAPRKAKNEAALLDPRVKAVRSDKAVGEGSCSNIDECYEHGELLDALNEEGITDPVAAVKWARESNAAYWGRGLDQLCGDDNETDLDIKANAAGAKALLDLPIEV